VIDVFSGAGGFALGLQEAAAAAGYTARFEAALDIDAAALASHRRNLRTRRCILRDAALCVDYALRSEHGETAFAYVPEVIDDVLAEIGTCDIVIGGPPCQGHSNLNNHTRRSDQRNGLYYVVAAIGVALKASVIIIENVSTVLRDQLNVVEKAKSILRGAGYSVADAVLRAEEFGVAQTRRRHFLVATKGRELSMPAISGLRVPSLTVLDAIEDLLGKTSDKEFDRPTLLTPANAERVRYLFAHGLHDLPNDQRPDCHKDGHTYPSVYGRLRASEAAQTIKGGFLQPGQGRFIHPL
jgi:DNA (cytosine-5)-methyltransferase 1